MQNGFAEGFSSTRRDQCLNEQWKGVCRSVFRFGRNTEHNRGLTPHNEPGKLSIEWSSSRSGTNVVGYSSFPPWAMGPILTPRIDGAV